MVELQEPRFDGETLQGRLLIGAREQSLRLDRRLIEAMSLTTESVIECGTARPLSFIIMDVYAPRRTEQDVLLLKPGYWYGKQVRIPLFTRDLNDQQGSPACIEARLTIHALGGQPVAQLNVRAERVMPPALDAGTLVP